MRLLAQILVGDPDARFLVPYFLQLFLLALLALLLCNCSSAPFDPMHSYYQSYCSYDGTKVDAATGRYWKYLCENSKKGVRQ